MADDLTQEGLVTSTQEEILAELETAQRADVDPLVSTESSALAGQYNGIYSSHLREIREVLQEAVDALDPDNAEGALLESICALTGTKRRAASKSRFTGTRKLRLNLEPGAIVPVGSLVNQLDHPEILFELTEEAENEGASAANFDVEAVATVTGEIVANAGTVTVITNPVVGWNSVINPSDAIVGRARQSDQELRVTREAELQRPGSATVNAIRADLLALDPNDDEAFPIIEAVVYENDTDFFIGSMPPHSVEAVIWDGTGLDAEDADVAQAIFDAKAGGIATTGLELVQVADSYGVNHGIRFTRATQLLLDIEITLEYDVKTYVGDDAVKTAVSTAFQLARANVSETGQRPGQKASFSAYMAVVQSLKGVRRITDWTWNLPSSAPVTFQDLTIGAREIALTDTTQITIISTPAT